MTAKSTWRGHEIEWFNDEVFIYSDTRQPVSENKDRRCGHCNKPNRPDDHDPCLGELPGVKNACCGHGVEGDSYIQFLDGRHIFGEDVTKYLADRQNRQTKRKVGRK